VTTLVALELAHMFPHLMQPSAEMPGADPEVPESKRNEGRRQIGAVHPRSMDGGSRNQTRGYLTFRIPALIATVPEFTELRATMKISGIPAAFAEVEDSVTETGPFPRRGRSKVIN
jgi:hypothetical protein